MQPATSPTTATPATAAVTVEDLRDAIRIALRLAGAEDRIYSRAAYVAFVIALKVGAPAAVSYLLEILSDEEAGQSFDDSTGPRVLLELALEKVEEWASHA